MALIVDIQEKLVPVIYNSEELIANTIKLIKGLNELDVPIIISQQYTKGLGMTVPEILDACGEDVSFYYDKLSFSCAQDETILSAIKACNKKNIIICGMEAHICVLQTVIDLIMLGYNVILIEDCISSRREADKHTGIKRAYAEGAIPASYESLLFELMQCAGTESFKKISAIIK